MAYLRDHGTFILYTDAGDLSIGAVWSQTQDGEKKAIPYVRKRPNIAESNYCDKDKKLIEIRYLSVTTDYKAYGCSSYEILKAE